MKTIQTIITLLCLVFFTQMNAQTQRTEKQKERAENQVKIYTSTERDNLQMWMHERVTSMELTKEQDEQYYSIILYYIVKMSRLNDKDMELTEEEIFEGIDDYVAKINSEVQPMLSDEQYQIHLGSFEALITSVHNRMKQK